MLKPISFLVLPKVEFTFAIVVSSKTNTNFTNASLIKKKNCTVHCELSEKYI